MSKEVQKINGNKLLQDITQFIARYLQCSEHQRTVLALWVLHTHCFKAAQVAPYLSIRSAHKQSGKTLCLQLLSLLCDHSVLTSGLIVATLTRRMKERFVSTVLLDECQATLGTRARSKAPALRALLAGGYHREIGYNDGLEQRNVFCPKAFAGKGQLPEELADRSLPIILQPLGAQSTGPELCGTAALGCVLPGIESSQNEKNLHQKIHRFRFPTAEEQAKPLKAQLYYWKEQNHKHLETLQPYDEDQFPSNFSHRRRDMCEPLLQLADTVGGEWPNRIRQALITIFEEETAFNLQTSLQLLSDLHNCFFFHGFPARLSTSTLLDWTSTLPPRPWDVDGPMSAHKLAQLLMAFDVRPRVQRTGKVTPLSLSKAGPARGYQLHDFFEPWRRQLGLNVSQLEVIHLNREIPNKNKDCNGVSQAGAHSIPGGPDGGKALERSSLSPVPCNLSPTHVLPSNYQLTNLPSYQLPEEGLVAINRSQELEAPASEIAKNNAVCNGVS